MHSRRLHRRVPYYSEVHNMSAALLYRNFLSYSLLFLLVCFLSVCSSGQSNLDVGTIPPQNNVPPAILEKAQRLTNNLVSNGYEVSRGYLNLFGIDQCPTAIAVMGNCYGNNPVAPYIFYVFPPWPNEYVDPSTRNAFGRLPDGYISAHRFDPREAIIVIGNLPPLGRYFGYQTYLFTKKSTINTSDPTYLFLQTNLPSMLDMLFNTSPNPDRLTILGSIGNSINHVVIEWQAGTAFNQERVFITTPDQAMERNIKAALLATGVANVKDIFVEPVSSDYRIGLSADSDDFITAFRYAMPQDNEAGDKWRSDLPLVVLRVRGKNTTRPAEPYPPATLDARTANSENSLKIDLQNLIGAVKDDWGQASATTKEFLDAQTTLDLVGPHCNLNHGGPNYGMNCLGDTQDTSYQPTLGLNIDNNEVYAVIGTLQSETGNASYVNLSIYDNAALFGVVSIDDAKLVATANRYSGKTGNTDKLYVYYITRDCSKNVFTSSGACTSITEDIIPKTKQIKIIQRGYVRPGAARGPDSTQILKPYLVLLNGS